MIYCVMDAQIFNDYNHCHQMHDQMIQYISQSSFDRLVITNVQCKHLPAIEFLKMCLPADTSMVFNQFQHETSRDTLVIDAQGIKINQQFYPQVRHALMEVEIGTATACTYVYFDLFSGVEHDPYPLLMNKHEV